MGFEDLRGNEEVRNEEVNFGTVFEHISLADAKSGRLSLGTDAFMRDHNEDRLFVDIQRDVFAVVDGIGGYAGGEKAAEIVVDALKQGLMEDLDPSEIQRRASASMKLSGITEGGACYVAIKIERKKVKIWYAGDSGLVVFDSKGKIKFENKIRDLSHAPTGKYPGRTNIEHADLMNYDRILLATDGLWDNLIIEEAIDEIKEMPVDAAVRRLSELARKGMTEGMSDGSHGNKDNLSIILYEILPVPLRKNYSDSE